jgi:ABC-type transport system involved in cytochrome c biogenesis permease subunit
MNSKKTLSPGKRFYRISLPVLFAFVSLNLLSGSLFAQPNFSGLWAFNEAKNIPLMVRNQLTRV